MRILVIGGGGREHTIIKFIKKNPKCKEIFCLPGNGGISEEAVCQDIKTTDIEGIVKFAKEKSIDYAIVASDDPLVLGAVDRLEEIGVPCFGPDKKAAAIEGSKAFSKQFMEKYHIPTAHYKTFDNPDSALKYIRERNVFPLFIKTDGLALGKGAIFVPDMDTATSTVNSLMREKIFGDSGNTIVVEEMLYGPEVSVLAFTDGKTILPMVSSMDHKRALDGDKGLNTGGMGTIAPNPHYTEEISKQCMEKIFIPTIKGMNAEGRKFKGCLYFGLMLTEKGPFVIEYNCRFGDPETQVVLPLIEGDLLEIMLAVTQERLGEISFSNKNSAACCVILASGGYPEKYEKGKEIDFGGVTDREDLYVIHAGTQVRDGKFYTNGGRVLGISAQDKTLEQAIEKAYANAEKIKFDNMYYRKDIGKSAISLKEGK